MEETGSQLTITYVLQQSSEEDFDESLSSEVEKSVLSEWLPRGASQSSISHSLSSSSVVPGQGASSSSSSNEGASSSSSSEESASSSSSSSQTPHLLLPPMTVTPPQTQLTQNNLMTHGDNNLVPRPTQLNLAAIEAMADESSSDESEESEESGGAQLLDIKARHRIWHLTIFNTTRESLLMKIHSFEDRLSRGICCEDRAPGSGTVHFHLALVCINKVTFSILKKHFGPTINVKVHSLETMKTLFKYVAGKGSHRENKQVIFQKNAVFTEKIESATRQEFHQEFNKNMNTLHLVNLLKQPKYASQKDQIRHCLAMIALANSFDPIRSHPRVVAWVYGESGSGKSLLGHTLRREYMKRFFKPARVMTISNTAGQFGGVIGDEGMVLIDDLKLHKVDVQDLLVVCDQYNQSIDVKRTTVAYQPDIIMVTSIFPPDFMPPEIRQKWGESELIQLNRRLTYTIQAQDRASRYLIRGRFYTLDQVVDGLLRQAMPPAPEVPLPAPPAPQGTQ